MDEQKGAATLITDTATAPPNGTLESEMETIGTSRRNLILGIVNVSHVFNHMQSNMVSVLYPVMMAELGFGYFAVSVLQTIYQLSAMGLQVVYGLLVRFFPRAILLGIGNMIAGTFYMATGLSQSFT
jgi:MFS family permease